MLSNLTLHCKKGVHTTPNRVSRRSRNTHTILGGHKHTRSKSVHNTPSIISVQTPSTGSARNALVMMSTID